MSKQYGDGSGSGNGYGSGDGSGSGSGDGSSYGDGSGSGDGSGDGHGDGYSSGDGHGDGDGSIEIPEEAALQAWHFVTEDGRLRYEHDGERPEVYEGLTLSCDPDELEMCRYGLHASRDKEDARLYCDGIACRVEVWGQVLVGEDKLCAEHRRVVEVYDE